MCEHHGAIHGGAVHGGAVVQGAGARGAVSRRTALRAGAVAAAGLGLAGWPGAGTALAAPAAAPGECGPTADDPHFADRLGESSRTFALAAAETSYNGWTVGQPPSTIGVETFTVSGTSISLQLRSGDVAAVLLYIADRFNREVEPLRRGQCGGYSYRMNVNNPKVWSNHASGTAMDLNWELHPNGRGGTFNQSQVAAIRSILNYCGGVVFWGGDYRGTIDEMHFEIDVRPGDSDLPALVRKIQGNNGQKVGLRAQADGEVVCAESGGAAPLIANRSVVGLWETFNMISLGGGNVALRAAANGLYVCAESGGAAPLVANRSAIGQWETFQLITNPDDSFSLRARANGRLVCAEAGGSRPLIANRDAIGQWERFDLLRF